MPEIPTLTDGVVVLRAPRPGDAQGSWEQCQDPESQRWTTVPVPYALTDAESYLGQHVPQGWADDSEWGFVLEAGGRYAGTVSLRNEGVGRGEVAYGAHPWARGTGYVERALRLLLEWGFTDRGLRVVAWRAHRGNWASRRLAWRLGFTVEGTVRGLLAQRGELRDAWIGSLLREDAREPRTPWLANPAVAGGRVRLRPFAETDLPRLVEGLGDADTQHWLAFVPRDPGVAEARAFLETVQERLADAEAVTWAVGATDDDRLLGVMGLYRFAPGREAELGFWTHPAERGRGLTTEAARLAVDHAFGPASLGRLTAYASAANHASRRVLTGLGLRQTGVQRGAARTGDGAVVDLVGYDLLAEEWPSRR